MSPTNLADLPANEPAPTGLVQVARGRVDGVANYVWGDSRQWIHDGVSPCQIRLTPPRDGWWLLRAETIWSTNYGGWTSLAWSIQFERVGVSYVTANLSVVLHSTIGWQESVCDFAQPVSAGVDYVAGLVWENFAGAGTHSCWTGPGYMLMAGEFVAEGAP